MTFDLRSSIICFAISLSGILGSIGASPAIAAPFDQLEQTCKPKSEGSHACLESVPAYSYHLGITSGYGGELCLELGSWEGKNNVVVEWDGLQARLQLTGKAGVRHLLEPSQRAGRSSAIVLYSEQPILPSIALGSCGSGQNSREVTAVSWPEEGGLENNIAQQPETEPRQDTQL